MYITTKSKILAAIQPIVISYNLIYLTKDSTHSFSLSSYSLFLKNLSAGYFPEINPIFWYYILNLLNVNHNSPMLRIQSDICYIVCTTSLLIQ